MATFFESLSEYLSETFNIPYKYEWGTANDNILVRAIHIIKRDGPILMKRGLKPVEFHMTVASSYEYRDTKRSWISDKTLKQRAAEFMGIKEETLRILTCNFHVLEGQEPITRGVQAQHVYGKPLSHVTVKDVTSALEEILETGEEVWLEKQRAKYQIH